MDSGNSASLQSSSGGDDEYDSRNESISAFLTSQVSGGALTNPQQISQLPPPPPSSSQHHLHHHQQNPNHPTSSLFDPFSNYFDVFSSRSTPQQNPISSPLDLDMVWSSRSSALRSDHQPPNSSTHVAAALMASSSSSSTQPIPLPIQNPAGVPVSSSDHIQTNNNNNVSVRPSKKRSRASRRAPTTVLTTDTSNFRAMVQEFTGIPAPPFSASPFPRGRLDLFNTASTLRSGHLETARPPPYLLRPFAQKVQPPPSTMSTNSTIPSNNFQLLSELGLSTQSQNLTTTNMQNPSLLTFQSLLQSTYPQKFGGFGENSQGLLSNTRMGALEEFNVNRGQARNNHINEQLPNFVTSDEILTRNEQESNFNENFGNSQRVNTCKMNYNTASSSHEKGSDQNVSSRGTGGEGMVDSWICSSD